MFSHLQWAGAINAGTWDILFVLQLLLALNRLSVILKNIFLISIKGRELPWERRLFNVGIFSEENHFILIASISAASTALHVGPFPLSNPPPNFLIFPLLLKAALLGYYGVIRKPILWTLLPQRGILLGLRQQISMDDGRPRRGVQGHRLPAASHFCRLRAHRLSPQMGEDLRELVHLLAKCQY